MKLILLGFLAASQRDKTNEYTTQQEIKKFSVSVQGIE